MRILFVILLAFPLFVRAESGASSQGTEATADEQIQEKAKRRHYPGGQDESDLKVQAQLSSPSRKIAPTAAEEPAEPSNDAD